MEAISINLTEIFDNKLISTLLKNDCVIYGGFVREIVVQGVTLEDYSKKQYNVISCYAKYIFSDIIERDIYEYITSKLSIIETKGSKNTLVSYQINIDGHKFVLEMLYIRAIYGSNIYSFENDLACLIDIDSLSIRRCGLYCLEIFYNSPFLFSDVIKNIINKTFEFKTLVSNLTYNDIRYIQSVITDGYTNRNNNLIKPESSESLECSICYDKEDTNRQNYYKLGCGHIYHSKCIKEAINTYFNDMNTEYYRCPYCSTKLLHTEIL